MEIKSESGREDELVLILLMTSFTAWNKTVLSPESVSQGSTMALAARAPSIPIRPRERRPVELCSLLSYASDVKRRGWRTGRE